MPVAQRSIVAFCFSVALAAPVWADNTPDVLFYKFNAVEGGGPGGTTVPNLASAPPLGAENATIMGGITQDGADLNTRGGGYSLKGTGVASSTDYLNTGWSTSLPGSFTISFKTRDITPSSTLFYIFGDNNAGSFRCFTNGVAGPNNWILRGTGITDTYANGAAVVARSRTTFVYNAVEANIKAYINGALVSTVAQSATPVISGAGPFKVMGYGTNVGSPAGGLLDDFRVYNRALSDAEVANIDEFPIVVSGNAIDIPDGDTTPNGDDGTDFGNVVTEGQTLQRSFVITNYATADLTLGEITITGPDAADFTITTLPDSTIAQNASSTLTLTFDPGADGLRSATVNIPSNDTTSTPYTFDIVGNGAPENIFVDSFEELLPIR